MVLRHGLRALGVKMVGTPHVSDHLGRGARRPQLGEVGIAQVVGLAGALHVVDQTRTRHALAGGFRHLTDGERHPVAHLELHLGRDTAGREGVEDFGIDLGAVNGGAGGQGEGGKEKGGSHNQVRIVSAGPPAGKSKDRRRKTLATRPLSG